MAQHRSRKKEIGKWKPSRHNKDKTPITIYLVSGVKLAGRIRSFDKYSVVLETSNQEQLIFKHAISTVVIARGAHSHMDAKPTAVAPHAETAISNAASGTEG